jgi:menaquinone-9 beta-reductase
MCAVTQDRYPVVIVGASYAGLAAAMELGDRALLIDQHAVGAIQHSACAMPLDVADRLGVRDSVLQTYPSAIVHTPYGETEFPLPSPYCIFDHERLCKSLFDQAGSAFLRARVSGVDGNVVHTSEGDVYGDVLIDASGWSGALVTSLMPDTKYLERRSIGIEADVPGRDEGIHFYADSRYAPGGYAWVFPAHDTLRIGVLSYQPQANLKSYLARFLDSLGYAGKPCRGGMISWFSRPSVVENIMVAGDAAGHCLPITAEGIRFAMQFGALAGHIGHQISDGAISLNEGLTRYKQIARKHRRRVDRMRPLQMMIQRSPDIVMHGWMKALSTWLVRPYFLRSYTAGVGWPEEHPMSVQSSAGQAG